MYCMSIFIIQMLHPYSCQGAVAAEAMDIVKGMACELEKNYRARVVTDIEGSVAIYTLTKDEGDLCLKKIEDAVNSTHIITKMIPVSPFQAQCLEKNHKLKSDAVNNKVDMSLLKDQSVDCTVTLKGTVNQVNAMMLTLKQYFETQYSESSFDVEIETKHSKMWFKHWQQLKIQKEAEQDVMLKFVQKQIDQNSPDTTLVTFNVWGDLKCIDELKSFIQMRDCGSCYKGILQRLPKGGAPTVAKGFQNNEVNIHSLALYVEIDETYNTMMIVAPLEASDNDIKKAREEILLYLDSQKTLLALSDPIMGLILASPKYSSKLNDIILPHNVKVVAQSVPTKDLVLMGNPAAVESITTELQQLQTSMSADIDQVTLVVDPQQVPTIQSNEFVRFCKTIQDELFVYCSSGSRKMNTVLENPLFIQPTPLSHSIKLEIVQGILVNEEVYAIVNNANENLVHSDGLAKLIADDGGPTIQSSCENYVRTHGKLRPGEAVCLDGGSLLCHKVIHAVWPKQRLGRQRKEQVHTTFVNILNLVQAERIESVSFSVFGTNIPPELFAQSLFMAIYDFSKEYTSTPAHIQKVRCVLPDNGSIIEAFISALHKCANCLPEQPSFSLFKKRRRNSNTKDILRSCSVTSHSNGAEANLPCDSSNPELPIITTPPDVWQWQDDKNMWVNYSSEICTALTREYAHDPRGSHCCTIDGQVYFMDFCSMTQTNTKIMKHRCIRCIPALTASPPVIATTQEIYHGNATSNVVTPKDTPQNDKINTLLLKGLKCNLENSKIRIREMLDNACCTTDTPHSVPLPPEWQPQTKTTVLFPLSSTSTEWNHVAELFQKTMPQTMCTIGSIQRIQNKWLWERYILHKKRLLIENDGVVNEKELFHGSHNNDPKLIYEGQDGFDLKYSTEGVWGRANYFAVNASYSNSYAYTNAMTGQKEMFLVKLLAGESYNCPPNSNLREPPPKPGKPDGKLQLEQVKYNTVTISTWGSEVLLAYDNQKAYPAYLIEYIESMPTL